MHKVENNGERVEKEQKLISNSSSHQIQQNANKPMVLLNAIFIVLPESFIDSLTHHWSLHRNHFHVAKHEFQITATNIGNLVEFIVGIHQLSTYGYFSMSGCLR